MSTTQPFRKIDEIEKLKHFFHSKGEIRNYVLITLGVNTALRISDLLQITWEDVWNFHSHCFKEHMVIVEQKTGKTANVYLNTQCQESLQELKEKCDDQIFPSEHIFKSRVGKNKPIGRNRAYVIVKDACRLLGYEGNLACHSLRKTFGYHAWKQGASPAIIMSIYNHSSMEVTKRYLSIEQDDKDDVFRNIML